MSRSGDPAGLRMARSPEVWRWFGPLLMVAAATLILCWPAIWNGYPLLYPDSFEYLGYGHGISMKLRGMSPPAWMYECMRSEIYALSIFLLHGKAGLWSIAGVQAGLTAWVLWLVVRSLCSRPLWAYGAVVVTLSTGTTVAWYASYIMPDILGPVLYLCLYLLVFAPESLGRVERAGLVVLACWGAASHSTHLVLAVALGAWFAVLRTARWPGMRGRGGRLLWVAGIVAVAAAAQMVVHARLYGKASLFGNPPPFLMARLLGDGPARLYLQQHCRTLPWTICLHVGNLPTTEASFLWAPTGIWKTATPLQRASLRREELPLLVATLRASPREQMGRSWANFVELLMTVGPADFWNYGTDPAGLEFALPGLGHRYALTRQSRNDLPQRLFGVIERRVIVVSLSIVALLLPWLWRRGRGRLLGLAATVVFVVPVNALLCGVVSCNDPRLQDRVVWLVAMLAGIMVWMYWTERLAVKRSTNPTPPV